MNNNNTEKTKRKRVQHKGGGTSRTRQADTNKTDINKIVGRYIAHGIVPQAPGTARYGDFSSGMDFKTAMDKVTAAQSEFNALPSRIRAHVNHDPGAFLDMVLDETRREELVELGMLPQMDPGLPAPATEEKEAFEEATKEVQD